MWKLGLELRDAETGRVNEPGYLLKVDREIKLWRVLVDCLA